MTVTPLHSRYLQKALQKATQLCPHNRPLHLVDRTLLHRRGIPTSHRFTDSKLRFCLVAPSGSRNVPFACNLKVQTASIPAVCCKCCDVDCSTRVLQPPFSPNRRAFFDARVLPNTMYYLMHVTLSRWTLRSSIGLGHGQMPAIVQR